MAAARAFSGPVELTPAPNVVAIFDAVETGAADLGVIAIENSIEGGVNFNLDRLLEAKVSICGEIIQEIDHCLLSRESDLARVERVFSHPQALAQCQRWLRANLPNASLIPATSTAAAAEEVRSLRGAASISNRLTSEVMGLPILAERIQDHEQNATRFVILGKSDAARSGHDKTSIAFSTPHEKGALLKVLKVFDAEDINLTRIESRPLPHKMWQYVFFTDLEGHRSDANVSRALSQLMQLCGGQELLKVLGSYPRWRDAGPKSR
jgi:chorismate mutase/prephenate dehydratase